MESVCTQLLSLMRVAGYADLPNPLRRINYHRDNAGLITIPVNQGECLAVLTINGFGIDLSKTNTLAIKNSADTYAQRPQPLATILAQPVLYLFQPGKAIFNFVFTQLPLTTSRVQVLGFRLPAKAYDRLRPMSVEEVGQ